jgi:hypothetical protein
MSDNELGRPSYKAPAAKPPNSGLPPRPREEAAKPGRTGAGKAGAAAKDDAAKGADTAGRRFRRTRDAPGPTPPPWAEPPQPETPQKPELPRKPKASQKPDAEAKAPKKKPEDLPPEAARTIYVPVRQNRGAGYALWAVLRFIVLAIVKVVTTMVKIALSPFHAMGG